MSDHIRAKLEALITDSSMFNAGQQDERLRLCSLIDIRLDQLHQLDSHPHISARREELLNIRQAARRHDGRALCRQRPHLQHLHGAVGGVLP